MLITAADGTRLHVVDWGGDGRTIVLIHAWGLNSTMWTATVPGLASRGHRVITPDRRGHGRSDLPGAGYDLDTLAIDIGTVLEQLDLRDVVLLGHSMGGTEVARLVGGIGTDRVAAMVLSAPVTPCITQSDDNLLGMPAAMLDANRAAMAADIGGWIAANAAGYWGRGEGDDRPLDSTWTEQTLLDTPLPVLLATNRAMTSADVRSDLANVTCPTLVVHGDADLSAPIDLTGRPTAALVPGAQLCVIAEAGHGLYTSYSGPYTDAIEEFVRQL
ncbi:MAG: alpha/beta hydrolase [Actinobacteria bacterium]|nr:alpha/beta hydrolase [Actinomycetota bacterium]